MIRYASKLESRTAPPAPRRPSPRAGKFGLALLPLATLLGGCNLVVLDPSGDIARQQADLVVISTLLMLLIIVPVMALTVLFAWRYRHNNKEADYQPDWDHSTQLELVIWAAPLLIIIALGAITWFTTHLLDPYRPLDRIAPGKPVAATNPPLEIQVVSLDWKWLFIYPEQGIATVNALALPVDRPIRFRLTSSAVMNAFYVPTLAGMIYTMPGMETKLHAVLNKTGDFGGVSSNYSGAGFSDMRFQVRGMDAAGFDQWVARMKQGGGLLDAADYAKLERPSEKVPQMRWSTVQNGLFDRIVNQCTRPGQTCMSDIMRHDMHRSEAGRPPVNDHNAPRSEGALMKSPDEHESSPHQTAPHNTTPPGKDAPGNEANRNMTWTDVPAMPGTAALARS